MRGLTARLPTNRAWSCARISDAGKDTPQHGAHLTVTFDTGRLSSDDGVIVLRETALKLGLAEVITSPLPDVHDPMRVTHTCADMALARMAFSASRY